MISNYSILHAFVCTILLMNLQAQEAMETNERIEALIDQMTLEEKIGQLVMYNGTWDLTGPPSGTENTVKVEHIKSGQVGAMLNVLSVEATRSAQELALQSRLKIPLLFGYDVIHGYKTMFPIPIAETASWDTEVMKTGARVAASEASAAGINWTFAPMIDITRDARWGRVMESAGEDPYLGSIAAVARIQGFQGDDLKANNTIAACAKHFAAYGFAEGGRDYNTVIIDDATLHNIVLPPFKAAVDAGVATMMNSFNEINGIPATGHRALQRDLLKGEWNWPGLMVSDWASIGEMMIHGHAADTVDAAAKALNAGSDMDMEAHVYRDGLALALSKNLTDANLLDDAVRRILKLKFDLGLFDDPFKYCNEEREQNEIYSAENLSLARDAARKSIVLLKNEGNLLPLPKSGKTIAVIGPLANDKNSPLGSWRAQADPNTAVSLLEGINAHTDNTNEVLYAKGADLAINERIFVHKLEYNTEDRSGFDEAIAIAKKADVVLLAIGEDCFQSGEGRSVTDISLKGVQPDLLKAVYEANPNTVVVLMNGRPLDISWAADHVPTIIETWHLGSQAGHAIADVLFGDYNPSGKLPVSFPYNTGQVPIYYYVKNTGRPDPYSFNDKLVFWSHYTDAPKVPLYPFGHGLSYTNFSYSNLRLSSKEMSTNDNIELSVDITNTGERKGKEVVQLYLRDLVGSLTRPIKQLKGYEMIELEAGETKTVTFTIDQDMLKFYTANGKWEVEPGDFKVFVGGSSDTELEGNFKLK